MMPQNTYFIKPLKCWGPFTLTEIYRLVVSWIGFGFSSNTFRLVCPTQLSTSLYDSVLQKSDLLSLAAKPVISEVSLLSLIDQTY